MSRFNPLDVVYVKFPYGGIETTDTHPALILKVISDSNGNEFAVVAAGTCAVDKKTYELKSPQKKHELMVTGDLLEDAGLTFPTYFKFNPMVIDNGSMTDGSIITISLDDRFLAVEPRRNKTKLGSLPLSDTRISSQIKSISTFVNLEKIIDDQVNFFSEHGFSFLRQKQESTENNNMVDVKNNVKKIREKNNFKLPKNFIKKP